MTGTSPSPTHPLPQQQSTVWMRGLLTVAWADGNLDTQEEAVIATVLGQGTIEESPLLEPLSPADLAAALGHNVDLAENFLRSAVMVALADGAYSDSEAVLLEQYCEALGLKTEVLQVLRSALETIKQEDQTIAARSQSQTSPQAAPAQTAAALRSPLHHTGRLDPVRDWLDQMSIQDPKVARVLCRLIPPQCPFERDVTLFGHKVAHIPALCKLNPLYDQLVGLRFRALTYLADDCGEDVSPYC